MSVDIHIRQKKLFKTKPGLSLLQKLCRELQLSYGESNAACALEEYKGGEDITDNALIVYNRRLGRGFQFQVQENRQDCALYLNIPCAPGDVADYYGFAAAVCKALGAKQFEQDGTPCPLADIARQEAQIQSWNADMLRQFARRSVEESGPVTVFGAVYPLTPEPEFYRRVLELPDEEAVRHYADYLHQKQDADYYYAKANFYKIYDEITGMYVLTQDVASIVPLTPEIPVFSGTGLRMEDVRSWEITFGALNEDTQGYTTLGRLTFDEFAEKVGLAELPRFDNGHAVVELSTADMARLELRQEAR